MSVRSVFISKSVYPFFEEVYVTFDWFGGFALSQKRKCQIGLHQNFLKAYPDRKVLEISSASLMSLGSKLSAMNLSKRTSTSPSHGLAAPISALSMEQTGPIPASSMEQIASISASQSSSMGKAAQLPSPVEQTDAQSSSLEQAAQLPSSVYLTTVESAFQSSRIYHDAQNGEDIGPFPEYLFLPGKECKKLVKEASKGLISYQYLFDGMAFYAPTFHISLFYDYLYLNALLEPENAQVRDQLMEGGYTAFTDLATKSLNSQARSAAIFVGLVQAGKVDLVKDYDSYLQLFRTRHDGSAIGPESYENVQLLIKDQVKLLSPVVPCTFHKEDAEVYYKENCYMLTNKKDPDNYLG